MIIYQVASNDQEEDTGGVGQYQWRNNNQEGDTCGDNWLLIT